MTTTKAPTIALAASILLCVLLAINLRVYYICPCLSIEVAQTDLASATDIVFMERRPLVIVDRVADHLEMINQSSLRLLHIRASPPVPLIGMGKVNVRASRKNKQIDQKVGQVKEILHCTSARYTLIYQSHSETTHVQVHHPYNDSGVMIILRRHQTLILPPHWRFVCPEGALAHELHDTISLTLRLMGVTRRLTTIIR